MGRLSAHQCKRGYESALKLADGAPTQTDREFWLKTARAWQSRWKATTQENQNED